MIVTINTDASFYKHYNKGSYAFWIKCDQGKIAKSGLLKGNIDRPDQAEFQCLINAIHVLVNSGIEGITKVIINMDCLNVIQIMRGDKKAIQRYKLHVHNKLKGKLNVLLNGKKLKGVAIEYRHIKAHQEISSAKQWVNDWCDKEAKAVLRKWINEK